MSINGYAHIVPQGLISSARFDQKQIPINRLKINRVFFGNDSFSNKTFLFINYSPKNKRLKCGLMIITLYSNSDNTIAIMEITAEYIICNTIEVTAFCMIMNSPIAGICITNIMCNM